MKQVVVTTGEAFTDMDSFASAVAYRDLFSDKDTNISVVLPGVLNESITKTVKSWKATYQIKCPEKVDAFVIVDISDSKHFAKFVTEDKVTEIFDHHFLGQQDYWKNKLNDNAVIERVGACATLIWEEYLKRKSPNMVDSTTASLLITAILSNTLNLKSSVTTKRDKDALTQLWEYSRLPKDWATTYFGEVDSGIFNNVFEAVRSDIKVVDFGSVSVTVGQIELWDGEKFILNFESEIKKALASFGNTRWFITIASISEGKNYFLTNTKELENALIDGMGAVFSHNIGTTNKLWLRKEILNRLLTGNSVILS